MATDKLFTVFGTSKLNGEYKVRFANDTMRIKVLDKHGHTDITLVDLETPMSKYEGIKAIQFLEEFSSAAAQSAIAEYLEEKAPKAATAKAGPAVSKAKSATKAKAPTKTKAKVTEDENSAFSLADAPEALI
jgi:hypothetical protein